MLPPRSNSVREAARVIEQINTAASLPASESWSASELEIYAKNLEQQEKPQVSNRDLRLPETSAGRWPSGADQQYLMFHDSKIAVHPKDAVAFQQGFSVDNYYDVVTKDQARVLGELMRAEFNIGPDSKDQ